MPLDAIMSAQERSFIPVRKAAKWDRESYVPDGYESAEEFLKEARELYEQDYQADKENIDAAMDDLKFAAGFQWDEMAWALRQGLNQPCLTINTLPQFIGQVVGDRRINQVAIKVLPREDSDVDLADVRSDLIRNIEVQSRAQRIYNQTFEQQVTCGVGNFRVDLRYADDDVFDRDIFLAAIPNPLGVLWDFMSVDPTGRDARRCWVIDPIPRKVFTKRYPGVSYDEMPSLTRDECATYGWVENDLVRVCEYWRIIEREREIAMMDDGTVLDITDLDEEDYVDRLFVDEKGYMRTRTVMRKYAQMHLITGFAILEKPIEWPINRLPIIRAKGREVWVGERRICFGLIRWAKDPQRLKNFWRSVAAEMLSKAPRNQWLAPNSAVEGRENEFRQAHLSGDPLLVYNDDADAPPQRQPAPEIPAAILNEAALNTQDMKDTTGIHDASLGVRSNETSGRAILARQQEGDVATIIYHDNMNAAQQEAGDLINQFIPHVYDTVRTVRIIGEDQEPKLQKINDPNDPNAVDLAKGKYDVTISTGPAYMTRRIEAANSMIEAARVTPRLLEVAGDLIAKAQDWPGADEIAERIKRTIPPELLGEDAEGAGNPQQQAMQQAMQQLLGELQAVQAELQSGKLELQKQEADVVKAGAQAREAIADAAKAEAEAEKADIDATSREVEMLAGIGNHLDRFSSPGEPAPGGTSQPGQGSIDQ